MNTKQLPVLFNTVNLSLGKLKVSLILDLVELATVRLVNILQLFDMAFLPMLSNLINLNLDSLLLFYTGLGELIPLFLLGLVLLNIGSNSLLSLNLLLGRLSL